VQQCSWVCYTCTTTFCLLIPIGYDRLKLSYIYTLPKRKISGYATDNNQAQSEYKHVLANILRSRYVARMPPLEASSPGRRSNVENASVTRRPLISNARGRAHTQRKLGFALCCHSNATGAPIANPPNSAQLGRSLCHVPKLHPGPCSSVSVRPRTDRQTHRHTDIQTGVTTIQFASSTTHTKCNDRAVWRRERSC